MMMRLVVGWPKSEEELAAKVVLWLKNQDYEVYQEVETPRGIADIVGAKDNALWVIETKTALSLLLLGQAYAWNGLAHHVSVAIPTRKKYGIAYRMGEHILREKGIGLVIVPEHSPPILEIAATKQELRSKLLQKTLREEHKYYARAGNANGKRYTPFQGTKDRIVDYVKDHPGATIKEILENVKTHYAHTASARRHLPELIQNKVIPLRVEQDGNSTKYYPLGE